ncbi:phosphopantetheine-binding protein, partial [Empedobacter falsenii]|uniref:phosphopantetheine-binding protein n=1 Tax=Empedobacter falsenii TaxID=343874 RepID=UPI00056E977E
MNFFFFLYEAPKGEVEELLAKHWCELLGIEQVSRNDSFFMLGGNSLLAVRLVSRLRSAGYTLGLQDIFASPCLVDMAKACHKAQEILEIPANVITAETVKITPEMLPLASMT